MADAVSDSAWLQAMLDFEAGLAAAQARLGMIPPDSAAQIAASCRAERFDLDTIGRDAAASASPAVPVVLALTRAVPAHVSGHVHLGATTQDVLDTAMMLIARRALGLIAGDLRALADACASVAERHGGTLMAGRTLLQQALPITFGLKAAGWMVSVLEVEAWVDAYLRDRLAVQLGGAAGTLASLGDRGLDVQRELGRELDLPQPVLPWHTARARVSELGALLAVAAGAAGKIAVDVALLMQTEVGEVAEPATGGSSTLPHKRNPVRSVEADACVRGAVAQAGVLLAAMRQEHERAAGAWQAEWPALSECFRLAAGAVARARDSVAGLHVDVKRMRDNLELTRGLLLTEHVVMLLAPAIGRDRAGEAVRRAVERVLGGGGELTQALLAEADVREHLQPPQLEAALDPAGYLGAAPELIRRALAAHREARPKG